MDCNAPIGVFDSGIGGLTVVKELRRLMPYENFIYVGDTARVPYGSRPKTEIMAFMRQILNFLQTEKIKLAVIACNTMTAYGYEQMKGVYPFYLVPMNSGVIPALHASPHHVIGVIATEGTVKNEMHRRAANRIDRDVIIHAKACPEFVPLIEHGLIAGEAIEAATREYMAFFNGKYIETLIMGCTHYPLIQNMIQKYAAENVVLINPAQATAEDAFHKLRKEKALNDSRMNGKLKMCFSADLPKAATVAKLVLEAEDAEFVLVNLAQYA